MKLALAFVFGAACLLVGVGYSQAQESAPAKSVDRFQMLECEGVDNCTAWTFQRGQDDRWKGHSEWRTGEQAVLEMESAPGGKLVINRTDVVGRRAGLTATYRGSFNDEQHLGGDFTASYQGSTSHGNWYAFLGTAELDIPRVLHFCQVHCYTFTLENPRQLVDRTNPPGQSHQKKVLTVEKFTYDSVIIHRIDSGGRPFANDYIGRMSDDGNGFSGKKGWVMTWGARLNDLPQDDQERERRRGTQQQVQVQQLSPLRDLVDTSTLIVNGIQIYRFLFGKSE